MNVQMKNPRVQLAQLFRMIHLPHTTTNIKGAKRVNRLLENRKGITACSNSIDALILASGQCDPRRTKTAHQF